MKILFVCKSNFGRSQIAEAYFNKLCNKYKAKSAGTYGKEFERGVLSDYPNKVVSCMKEDGFDLSNKKAKQLTPRIVKDSDRIIILCKKEELPNYLLNSRKITFWNVNDPRGKDIETQRRIRNEIKGLIKNFIKKIEKETSRNLSQVI